MIKKSCYILFFLISCISGFSQTGDSLFLEGIKHPQKYRLAGLQIEGANFTDKNVINLLSGLTVGEEVTIPSDKVTDAIKKLWKQGLFEDVQIVQDKIIGKDLFLIIRIVERPRLTKFKFKGDVKKSDADDIRGKIRLLQERVVTDYMIGSIKNTVRDQFIEKGYYFAKIDITQVKDTTQKTPHTILTINVKKGRKVRIQDVIVKGNTVLSSFKVRHQLEDTKRRRWYNPFNSGKYLEDNLQKDLPSIAEKYNSKGYRDARVVKDSVYFVSDDRVTIEITIDEGHKYYFGKFKWFGNTKYRSGQLDTVLSIHAGDVYDQSKLEQKLFMNPNGYDVSSLYLDDGYLFFQVNQQESSVHNDTIDFDVLMYEGKQATINKVTVKGNDKTNDHVIYREIRTRPGQLFRRSDIIRTNRELSQLGYFNPEKLNVTPTPNPADGTVDIEYTVEEKPSDQIELSGGWGGAASATTGGLGVIGTLGVTFNNFSTKNFFKKEAWRPLPSGDGQRLSVRAQTNGLLYQSYNFSFTEPWLGGKKPNSLTFSVFHTLFNNGQKKYVNTDSGRVINPLRSSMSIWGGSLGLGRRLKWPDNYFNMFTNISYNHYALNNYGTTFIFPTGNANDLSLGINISRNSIDAPIYPKSGSNFVFSGQLTPPYSLFKNNANYASETDQQKYRFVEYQKYKFTAEWFTQLTNKKAGEGKEARNLVLRTKVGYGFLGRYNKNIGFSPFERFYMGGSGLSGFQNFVAREIIGLRGYPDPASTFSGDPICARYTMELRYPISLNPQATIFILGFAEAGNTWANFQTFNPFQVKRSAGVGLRVFLPMFGLLGVDYGWGFDAPLRSNSAGGNGQGQFHFTIGGTLGEL
jgi:outer membrane protein insertion porin family